MEKSKIVKRNRRVAIEWNADLITKLIKAVKMSECLWNVNSSNYKNRDARESIRSNIANQLGVTKKDVLDKWNSLRNTFRTALKTSMAVKRGQSGSAKKPSFPYFDEMSFLQPMMSIENMDSSASLNNSCDRLLDVKRSCQQLNKQKVFNCNTPQMMQCYTCGQKVNSRNSKRLFKEDGIDIVNDILALTGFWLTNQQDKPESICISCLMELNNAMSFRERCIQMFTLLGNTSDDAEAKAEVESEEVTLDSNPEDMEEGESEEFILDSYPEAIEEVGSEGNNVEIEELLPDPEATSNSLLVDNDDDYISECNSEYLDPLDDENYENVVNMKSSTKKRMQRLTVKKRRDRVNGRFFCDKCFRCFGDKSNLNVHMKRHAPKQFKCPECGRMEYTQHLVNLHMRIKHKGELPYECKYCGKRFDNSLKRLRHERMTHMKFTYPKLHACTVCNKSFKDKYTLKFHEVVHSGEQPFQCELCDVKFNRKSSLGAHYRSKSHKSKLAEGK